MSLDAMPSKYKPPLHCTNVVTY